MQVSLTEGFELTGKFNGMLEFNFGALSPGALSSAMLLSNYKLDLKGRGGKWTERPSEFN